MPMRPEPTYRDARSYRRQKPKGPALLPWILLVVIIAAALAAHYVAAQDKPAERPELRWGTPTAVEEFHEGFVSGHVGHHTEWTLEYLSAEKLKGGVDRKGFPFFADKDCPIEWRATLADYRGSGYDRGHRSPASDNKFSRAAMRSCFSLGNMFPQEPNLNRGPWRLLEEHVRDIAREKGTEVWVFTIDLYVPDEDGVITIKTIGEHHVWVPNECAKVVLIKRGEQLEMKAWHLPNVDDPPDFEECEASVDAIEAAAALDFFSGLDDEQEDAMECACRLTNHGKEPRPPEA